MSTVDWVILFAVLAIVGSLLLSDPDGDDRDGDPR